MRPAARSFAWRERGDAASQEPEADLPAAGFLDPAAGFLAEEAELPPASVLDLVSDDAAGLDSALPPSPFDADSFPVASLPPASDPEDSFDADSFDEDSFAFFRASEG